jgi:BirA family biotin operon repressor/biotin-[acetyl-CoA-carboxylase] ligase
VTHPRAARQHRTLDGVPAHRLAARWGVPHAAVYAERSSALDVVHELGATGAPHATSVIVEEQTAGRGRDGRVWHSPWGGVWLGMLIRGPLPADYRVLAIRAGLVVADVIDELVGGPRAWIKWPNDVLLADRKVSGILCEARSKASALEWLGLGVGVNVSNDVPASLTQQAATLVEFAPGVGRLAVLDRLVPALAAIGRGGRELDPAECAAFAARDWLRGRALAAPVPGRAAGIRPDGSLVVTQGPASVSVTDGHVTLDGDA